MNEPRLTFTLRPDGWGIDGELDHVSRAALHAWCKGIEPVQEPLTLELAGLEIPDSAGIAAAIEALRLLLQRTPSLTVVHSPHLLAHTLYRLGLLEEGRLALVEPRQEEPYG